MGLVIVGCGRVGYAPGALECAERPDGLVSAYSFDGDPVDATDGSGANHGIVVGAPEGLAPTTGPSGCGAALAFDPEGTGEQAWIEIPDSPDWDLRRGSLELWVRTPSTGRFAAIVSRDAQGTARSGHLALFVEPDGTLWARLQSTSATAYRCTEPPLAGDRWRKVGLNFGPPDFELWVDGAEQVRTTSFTSVSGEDVRCGDVRANWGIDGNDNPWIVGGSAGAAPEGAGAPVVDVFLGGAIDELDIAPFRRAF